MPRTDIYFVANSLNRAPKSTAAPEREHRKEEDGSCVGITSAARSRLAVSFLSLAAIAATPGVGPDSSPGELVQAAQRAEEQGDTTRRKELLAKALAIDPNYAGRRWQAGYVRAGDHWETIDGFTSDVMRGRKSPNTIRRSDRVATLRSTI